MTTSLMDRRAAQRGERTTGALARAAAAGEQLAWDGLVARYQVLVRSVTRAHRLSDADAQDVAQITWLRAVEHIGGLQDPDRFGAWLRTVARHESLRVLRKAAREVPVEACEPGVVPAVEDGDDDERRAAVRRALRTLPPRQRTLLHVLHTGPERSYETVGAVLGMPVGSIGPTRGRALERLRREVTVRPAAGATAQAR